MEKGYSLRKAAELADVPTMTFHGYKNRGIIKADIEDKKGNFTLYSDEQVGRAKDYYEKSVRSRKKSVKKENEALDLQETSEQVAPVSESVPEVTLPVAVEVITLEARADKIRKLQADVQRGIIEIGRELIAARKEVPHGQWGTWLANEFEWTDRTARNFIAVAERFGDRKTFSDLKPSTLQAMLSLPAGEEEAFMAEQEAAGNPVENQSAREVQANVKDWNQRKEQATADEQGQVDAEDNNTGDSAEDKAVDSEMDSLQVEDEEQSVDTPPEELGAVPATSSTVTDEDELKDTAAVDFSAQGTENSTRRIGDGDSLKRSFNLDDYRRRMKKQLEVVRKFISETEDEQQIEAVLSCLESFRTEVIDVMSLAGGKLASLHKALNDID